MGDPAAAARRVRTDHAALVATVDAAADRVDTGSTDSPATPLERELRDTGFYDRAPAAIEDAAAAAGLDLAADPVGAPPYVVVASTGPLLRGPAADCRLVVSLQTFEVRRRDGGRYERRDGVCVTAELR